MTIIDIAATQARIIKELDVLHTFDAETEYNARVDFLVNYARTAKLKAFVLGISGGVDSLVTGLLAQEAATRLRKEGIGARFIAVRLPYGTQRDEADAQACLDFIKPDDILTVDIKPATDAMAQAIGYMGPNMDFHVGNIKARQRMIAQYAIAAEAGGVVIGTDHSAEALMGFYTKFGDGAADVIPLAGLNKRRVRALGTNMGAPDFLVFKTPTADLESENPGLPDEDAFGVTYDEIDDFLEGKQIDPDAALHIIETYEKSAHKRALPAAPVNN